MEKQFGKPLTLKGLENGDLGDSKYSISREVQRENGKLAKDSGQLLKVADKGRETQKTNGHWNKCMSLGGIKSTAKETQCKYCDLKRMLSMLGFFIESTFKLQNLLTPVLRKEHLLKGTAVSVPS